MSARIGGSTATIEKIHVSSYKIPTDFPESDGTFSWNATVLVVVEAEAGGKRSMGYTYADRAAAELARGSLADIVVGRDAFAVPGCWTAMTKTIRNLGRPGIASTAISAVDSSLWDLKGRLLDLPLARLLGSVRDDIPVYGSGGFTSYPIDRLQSQLSGWTDAGIPRVKMKIGRDPSADLGRVRAAREAIGPSAELFVDANGAYGRKEALAQADRFAESGVVWFEEPVSSDDLDGLRLLRDRAPAGMDIAAGEYGYDLPYFRRMLEAQAVDVLQADASRCGGITGFLRVAALCEAWSLQLSAHCAPSLHVHPACALPNFRHLEYFHDHVRIERLLFDGALTPIDGALRPDPSRPGLGIEFKRQDAARYAV